MLHTPGHASDHLCFFLEEERVLFTGDTVLQGSTTVINPPDGNMAAYLQSLDRLKKRGLTRLCPGHGDVIEDPKSILGEYIEHRLARERQILDALREGPTKIPDLVTRIYAEIPEALHEWAARSVHAHLLNSRPTAGSPGATRSRHGRWPDRRRLKVAETQCEIGRNRPFRAETVRGHPPGEGGGAGAEQEAGPITERTGKRLADVAEAAEYLGLTADAVRALTTAAYLVPAGQGLDGPEFAYPDLKAFLARNAEGGAADAFPQVEIGPDLTSLLEARPGRADDMAHRALDIFSKAHAGDGPVERGRAGALHLPVPPPLRDHPRRHRDQRRHRRRPRLRPGGGGGRRRLGGESRSHSCC